MTDNVAHLDVGGDFEDWRRIEMDEADEIGIHICALMYALTW